MNRQIEQEIRSLRSQGISEDAIKVFIEMRMRGQTQQTPMSQEDTVVINSREGNVPGVYISEYQKQMDSYGALKELMDERARLETTHAELTPPTPIYNPNFRIETEGQRTTVGPQGQIIHY